MEIISKINDFSKKIQDFKYLCGIYPNSFQLKVLTDSNGIRTSYRDTRYVLYNKQSRQAGTTYALLLKVYKSVFIDKNVNDIIIICRSTESAQRLKEIFSGMIAVSKKDSELVRSTRFLIETKDTKIQFFNNNYMNLLGQKLNQEVYISDFRDTDENYHSLIANIQPLFPQKVFIFQEGSL